MSKILIIVGLIMMSFGFARVANASKNTSANENKFQLIRTEACEGIYWLKLRAGENGVITRPILCPTAEHCAGATLLTNNAGAKNNPDKPKELVSCVLPGQILYANATKDLQPLETEAEDSL